MKNIYIFSLKKDLLKYLKENDCVNKIIDRLDYKDEETKERMEYARKKVSEYIDKKLAED